MQHWAINVFFIGYVHIYIRLSFFKSNLNVGFVKLNLKIIIFLEILTISMFINDIDL